MIKRQSRWGSSRLHPSKRTLERRCGSIGGGALELHLYYVCVCYAGFDQIHSRSSAVASSGCLDGSTPRNGSRPQQYWRGRAREIRARAEISSPLTPHLSIVRHHSSSPAPRGRGGAGGGLAPPQMGRPPAPAEKSSRDAHAITRRRGRLFPTPLCTPQLPVVDPSVCSSRLHSAVFPTVRLALLPPSLPPRFYPVPPPPPLPDCR